MRVRCWWSCRNLSRRRQFAAMELLSAKVPQEPPHQLHLTLGVAMLLRLYEALPPLKSRLVLPRLRAPWPHQLSPQTNGFGHDRWSGWTRCSSRRGHAVCPLNERSDGRREEDGESYSLGESVTHGCD